MVEFEVDFEEGHRVDVLVEFQFLAVEQFGAVLVHNNHLHSYVVDVKVLDVNNHLTVIVLTGFELGFQSAREVNRDNLNLIPVLVDFVLPALQVAGNFEVVGNDLAAALVERRVVLVDVIVEHTLCCEVRCDACD